MKKTKKVKKPLPTVDIHPKLDDSKEPMQEKFYNVAVRVKNTNAKNTITVNVPSEDEAYKLAHKVFKDGRVGKVRLSSYSNKRGGSNDTEAKGKASKKSTKINGPKLKTKHEETDHEGEVLDEFFKKKAEPAKVAKPKSKVAKIYSAYKEKTAAPKSAAGKAALSFGNALTSKELLPNAVPDARKAADRSSKAKTADSKAGEEKADEKGTVKRLNATGRRAMTTLALSRLSQNKSKIQSNALKTSADKAKGVAASIKTNPQKAAYFDRVKKSSGGSSDLKVMNTNQASNNAPKLKAKRIGAAVSTVVGAAKKTGVGTPNAPSQATNNLNARVASSFGKLKAKKQEIAARQAKVNQPSNVQMPAIKGNTLNKFLPTKARDTSPRASNDKVFKDYKGPHDKGKPPAQTNDNKDASIAAPKLGVKQNVPGMNIRTDRKGAAFKRNVANDDTAGKLKVQAGSAPVAAKPKVKVQAGSAPVGVKPRVKAKAGSAPMASAAAAPVAAKGNGIKLNVSGAKAKALKMKAKPMSVKTKPDADAPSTAKRNPNNVAKKPEVKKAGPVVAKPVVKKAGPNKQTLAKAKAAPIKKNEPAGGPTGNTSKPKIKVQAGSATMGKPKVKVKASSIKEEATPNRIKLTAHQMDIFRKRMLQLQIVDNA